MTRREFVAGAAIAGLGTTLALDANLAAGSVRAAADARRVSFDQGWKFARGDFPTANLPSFRDRDWTLVDLPHDWSIAGPYGEHEPCGGSGGYLPTGIGWYRKVFKLPPLSMHSRVSVQFDGVYQRSEVWIDGQPLGLRPYGYSSFAYDLTPHLATLGGEHVLSVRVDNSSQPNSRWYSGSGITRHTWLVMTGPLHVAHWGVCVRATQVSTETASLELTTRIRNRTGAQIDCALTSTIVDPSGEQVGAVTAQMRITDGAEQIAVQRFSLATPVLWELSAPKLYSLHTVARAPGQPADRLLSAFGIRDARFDADRGFLLNGERVKLNGVCLHNDCGAVGSAVPERMWERRLQLLKQMGCNAIRTSHNPATPELLELCDRMGLLVMAEAFDEWRQPKLQTPLYGYHRDFEQWAARDLSDMIERDRNHPSIVIWSAGNEVPDQTDPAGPQTLQKLLDIFHAMDPTRPVTVGCDDIAAEPKATLPDFLDRLDVVGYNYVDRWRERREQFYAIDRHAFPARRVIGTESESMGGVRGLYSPADAAPIFGERSSNRRIAVEQLQKFIQTYDYVSGDFIWTGIDYLGEARWPNKLASSGVLDTCGFAKDGYYFYQSLWTREPVLHLFPHWNWPERAGQIVTIYCYTNCDTVELFLNGQSLGVKGFAFPRPGMVSQYGTYPPRAKALQTSADLHLSWDIPYVAGELKAVGTRAGEQAAEFGLRTTGPPHAIAMTADRRQIETDRADLAHVRVEIVDAAGLTIPTAAELITFRLEGGGRIIGVDNGQPDSHEPYQASARRTFNGLALVLVQSSEPAQMQLYASAPGLVGAQIQITAG